MPDRSGFEVLNEIRSNPATYTLPIIIHSSRNLSEQEAGLLQGAGAIIYPKEAFGTADSLMHLRDALSAAGLQP